MRTCPYCGVEFTPRRGKTQKTCGASNCKSLAQGDNCSVCGKRVHRGKTSRENIVCRDCRKYGVGPSKPRRTAVCQWCGDDFIVKNYRPSRTPMFCSASCAGKASNALRKGIPKRPESDHRRQRYERDSAAPGLSPRDRRRLLDKRSACYYCQSPATTVDHVVPLSRGGTNYEGNLVPCCRRCNSSKADRLLVEWRAGRPAGLTVSAQAKWLTAPRQSRNVKSVEWVQVEVRFCVVCNEPFSPKSTKHLNCSEECSDEYNRRLSREIYRATHGLPSTWTKPVKRRAS